MPPKKLGPGVWHIINLLQAPLLGVKSHPVLLGVLPTQRGGGTNNAPKLRIQHFKRANVIRVTAIVGDMIDPQYHKARPHFGNS